MPSFLCIFVGFNFFGSSNGENAWYIIWPAIFNVGWASVQISNLAIVNQLSYSQRKRDKMVVWRNGFTYIANIFVLSLALMLFLVVSDKVEQFRIMGCVSVALGLFSTLWYIVQIREKPLSELAIEREANYKKALG